jgi:hypothetical protein
MTDLNKIFKTTIKAIKLNSNIKVDPNQELNLKKPEQSRKSKSSVASEALDIVKNVTKLRDFLVDNKQNYIQPKFVSFQFGVGVSAPALGRIVSAFEAIW